jgi:hypothetical protein
MKSYKKYIFNIGLLLLFILKTDARIKNVVTDQYNCESIVNQTCICSKPCLEPILIHDTNTSYCGVVKCWYIKDEVCVKSGINFVAPLILSLFPITQLFGINYAVIQRWDLTALQLSVTFVPIILFCCWVFGNIKYKLNKYEDENNVIQETDYNIKNTSSCYSCCHSITIIVFWVLSVVNTATPNKIKDGNGCYLSGW